LDVGLFSIAEPPSWGIPQHIDTHLPNTFVVSHDLETLPSWTHLIRFVAVEDNQSHIGQLVDPSRDVGLDTLEGREVKAYEIVGTIFDGEVTENIFTVKFVSSTLPTEFEL
jgi:hypothetical protein